MGLRQVSWFKTIFGLFYCFRFFREKVLDNLDSENILKYQKARKKVFGSDIAVGINTEIVMCAFRHIDSSSQLRSGWIKERIT